MTLTVWGRKSSSNVQALMWCIGELGLEAQRHDIGHRFGGNDTPEFLAMNPNGTVPVLRDGENARFGKPGRSCAIWPRATPRTVSGPKTRRVGPRSTNGPNGPRSM